MSVNDTGKAESGFGWPVGARWLDPAKVIDTSVGLISELTKIVLGTSDVDPGADKRFGDEMWGSNPLLRAWAQTYLAWARSMDELVGGLDLDEADRARVGLATQIVTSAAAPTNTLIGNPAAMRQAVQTGGRSLVEGQRRFIADMKDNGAMPSMVDKTSFDVGENLAVTPGVVVHRDEVLELIRYTPTTPDVFERPLLVVPPQINKFYVMDLAPGRSMIEHAVAQGLQVYAISWRNARPEHADWDLGVYVTAIEDATEAIADLSGAADLNVIGVCAGGITTAATLAHLAATNDRRVNSVTFLVTVLDWARPSTLGALLSEPTVATSTAQSRQQGVLAGRDLSRVFSWLRPDDLVWSYWVNNYLMGNDPAPFDILYWNADNTNLPAALHADFVHVAHENALVEPGAVHVRGVGVDLSDIDIDAYVVGGLTDHITPWESCFESARHLGGATRLVLAGSGHIQTLVCPTGNPRAHHFLNDTPLGDIDTQAWKEGAERRDDSWWIDWDQWIACRSGVRVEAPRLDDDRHPNLGAAPGSYVHEPAETP